MTLDITQVIYASTIDTFKNFDSTTGSISVPAQSYNAGQYRSFNTTIALDETDAVVQVLNNFSFQSSRYYIGTFVQENPDANFIAQTRMTLSGSTLSVDLYVSNITGAIQSLSAFTLSIEVRRFTGPFS